MKKSISSFGVLVIFMSLMGVLIFMINEARSQTPDGQTPAEGGVCDGEVGAAYGLCTAYCEAMDCDSDIPAADDTACTKVAENFERISGVLPPCEAPVCSEEDITECGGEERICPDGSTICSREFRNGICVALLCRVPLP